MIECANECLAFVKETTTTEMISKLAPELQECLKKWDSLNDFAKGQVMGYMIGKYGMDILIGSGSMKAISLYRQLRRANALMNLETAATSSKHSQEIVALCSKEWKLRQEIFKNGNLKIQWDKQGKHVVGHKNYIVEKNKSIFTHKDPQKLIDEYAGTGKRVGNKIPGTPGYQEIVNFKEYVGYHVSQETGEKIPTTWGKIHYAKDGVHIVPTLPRN